MKRYMALWLLAIAIFNFVDLFCMEKDKKAKHSDHIQQHDQLIQHPQPLHETKLHKAAQHGDWKKVIKLYQRTGTIDVYNAQLQTPLHLAAAAGHIETAIALLQRKANPNARCRLGKTPLHLAAANGQLEMVQLLLAFGANPNERSNVDDAPSNLALYRAHIEIFILLLEAGAQAKIENIGQLTPSRILHALAFPLIISAAEKNSYQ